MKDAEDWLDGVDCCYYNQLHHKLFIWLNCAILAIIMPTKQKKEMQKKAAGPCVPSVYKFQLVESYILPGSPFLLPRGRQCVVWRFGVSSSFFLEVMPASCYLTSTIHYAGIT